MVFVHPDFSWNPRQRGERVLLTGVVFVAPHMPVCKRGRLQALLGVGAASDHLLVSLSARDLIIYLCQCYFVLNYFAFLVILVMVLPHFKKYIVNLANTKVAIIPDTSFP